MNIEKNHIAIEITEKVADIIQQYFLNQICLELLIKKNELTVIKNQIEGFKILDSIVQSIMEECKNNPEVNLENNVINTLLNVDQKIYTSFVKRSLDRGSFYLLTIIVMGANGILFAYETDFENSDDLSQSTSTFNTILSQNKTFKKLPKQRDNNKILDFRFAGREVEAKNYHLHSTPELVQEFRVNKDISELKIRLTNPMNPSTKLFPIKSRD